MNLQAETLAQTLDARETVLILKLAQAEQAIIDVRNAFNHEMQSLIYKDKVSSALITEKNNEIIRLKKARPCRIDDLTARIQDLRTQITQLNHECVVKGLQARDLLQENNFLKEKILESKMVLKDQDSKTPLRLENQHLKAILDTVRELVC